MMDVFEDDPSESVEPETENLCSVPPDEKAQILQLDFPTPNALLGSRVIVSGRAVPLNPSAEVVVEVNRTLYPPRDSNGRWQVEDYLGDMPYPTFWITAMIRDPMQRVSVNVTWRENFGTLFKSPDDGAVLPAAKPFLLTGEAITGSTVTVVDEETGRTLGTPTAGERGHWQLLITPPQGSKLTVKASHNGFGGSPAPVRRTFVISGPPRITKPSEATVQDPEFTVEGVGGVAGGYIEILRDGDHSTKYGEAPVTGDNWSVKVDVKPGRRSLVARQTVKPAPPEISTPRSFDIRPPALTNIDVTFPSGRSIKFAGAGLDGATVEIRVINSPVPVPAPLTGPVQAGAWEIVALNWAYGQYVLHAIQKVPNNAGGWIESVICLISFDYQFPVPHEIKASDEYQPTLSGLGLADAVVSFFDGDKVTPIAPDARVGLNGQWASKVNVEWGPTYQREIQIIQKLAQQTSDWVAYSVTIAPHKPVVHPVPTDDLLPVFSGTCWLNAVVELLFSDSGTTRFPAVVSGNTWSYQRPDPFAAEVPHTITAIQIAAQQSSLGETVTFQLPRPMVAPVITEPPKDTDVGRDMEVGGTGGMKGATLTVYDYVSGRELGSKVLPADGVWSMLLKGLPYGPLVIRAVQEIDGRESDYSEQHPVTVVVMPPEITTPTSGGRLTRTAMMEGKSMPNARIEVFQNGDPEPVLDTMADSKGFWKDKVIQAKVGAKTLRARQHFEGHISKDSQRVDYVVVPAPPIWESPANGEPVGNGSHASGFGEQDGDVVGVWIETDNGAGKIAEAVVGKELTWSARIQTTYSAQNYQMKATAICDGFASDPTAGRSLDLGTFEPAVDRPSEGQPVENPVAFDGRGRAGVMQVCSWFNPDLTWLSISVLDGVWAGTATKSLTPGGQWCVIRQSITDDAGGATISDSVTSHRFEVDDESANRHPLEKSDKRSG